MPKLIILDAFAGYNTATAGYFWNLTAPTIDPVAGRVGPGGVSTGRRSFPLQTTVCVGCAFKVPAAGYGFGRPLFTLRNDRGSQPFWVTLIMTADGRVYVQYDNITARSSPSSIPYYTKDQWFYYEFKVTHSALPDGAGTRVSYEAHINEGPVYTASGDPLVGHLDSPYYTAEIGFPSVGIGDLDPGLWNPGQYCDFYVTDGEFLGDIKNYIIKPDGDSAPSGWTPNVPESAHYLMVNDSAPDGEATTLSANDAGDQDMVTLEDIATTGIIRGIQANFIGQKTDAGVSSFRREYSWLGTPHESVIDQYLSYASFLNFPECFRKNPLTGADFTVEEINSMTMGVKRTA